MIPFEYGLGLSAVLFAIGVVGVLIRRNIIILLMCVELMLNAVNLAFVTMADNLDSVEGLLYVFFVMTVAAAEAAVGLAIVLAIFRKRETVHVDDMDLMKG